MELLHCLLDVQLMQLWAYLYFGKTNNYTLFIYRVKLSNILIYNNYIRWGWLAFNSGSTYGVSGQRWQYAARAAVSTMLASMGGGLVGLGFSLSSPNGIDILSQINGILGSLVAVTGEFPNKIIVNMN